MAAITVMTGSPAYGTERLYTVARFVLASLVANHKVRLFLSEDAVFAAKKGQKPLELPSLLEHEQMPNVGELLAAAIKEGAEVRACGVCAAERGLTQAEVMEGVKLGTMHDLVDWVATADKVVSF